MTLDKFTIKAQEAIQKAQEIAMSCQHQAIETGHLMKGILSVDENVTPFLLKKLEVNIPRLTQQVDALIDRLPRVSGGSQYLTGDANQALVKAKSDLPLVVPTFEEEYDSMGMSIVMSQPIEAQTRVRRETLRY